MTEEILNLLNLKGANIFQPIEKVDPKMASIWKLAF